LEDVLSDIFVSLSDLYPDLSTLISGQPDICGIEGRIKENSQQNREWDVHRQYQKIVLTGNEPKGKIIRGHIRKVRKKIKPRVIDEPGIDLQYHGYEDGGTHTVLKRKGENPESITGLIRPMPPTELLPRGRNDPVVIMEQYEDKLKKKSLRIVINTISPLCDIIISCVGAKQRVTVTPFLCKAVVDYLARLNSISIEEYSQMWENLQIQSYIRGRHRK
jgi:hypothetical protein